MNKEIVISDSYLNSYEALSRQSKKIVRNSMQDLAKVHTGNGFQVHKLDRTNCDKSFRSARCNRDLRIIFSDQGEKIMLLYVDHHDKAYNWAEGKFLHINDFGTLFVYDSNIEQKEIKEERDINLPNFNNRGSLLERYGVKGKDLIKLGVKPIHADYLMNIKEEEDFLEFISFFPEELQEGFIDLATGTKNLTEVYAELTDPTVGTSKSIDEALKHKNSKRRFYVLEDLDEMNRILDGDFEKWKLFLHPKQEEVVEKNYNGPVLIEGGPGTGKTVVGLHRATYLAKKVYREKDGKRILFCTYSRKLAHYIKEKLESLLIQNNLENNIDVLSVDQVIYKLTSNGINRSNIEPRRIKEIFKETYEDMDLEEPIYFYQTEYEEIIQKYHIRSLSDYLKVNRKGLGKALNPSARKNVWNFFEVFLEKKKSENLIDFEDQAFLLYKAVKDRSIELMYDSIIIDEAQDLSPIKIKAITSLVKNNKNNIMILSDQNQRIFRMNSWRKDTKLDIVGRTYHLDLNYRTTKQIKEYADEQFIFSEICMDHIKEYKSLLSGPEPQIMQFDEEKTHYNFIVNKVRAWLEAEIKPYEICIITPKKNIKEIEGVFKYEGIDFTILEKEVYPKPGNGVGVCSVQGCKGLEFRVVIIVNYDEIGLRTNQGNAEDWYMQMEINQTECQKYVATTRAREELIVTFNG